MWEALKVVNDTAKDRRKDRCANGTTEGHLRALIQVPDKRVRKLYNNRRKVASSLLVQLRTGKISFNGFLYSRDVPQVRSRRCACRMGDMTVKHIILSCQSWVDERDTYLDTSDRGLKTIPSAPEKATVAVRMILATEIPTRFQTIDDRAVKEEKEGVREMKKAKCTKSSPSLYIRHT